MRGSYYVYALKDPTAAPAQPFYIGKGTGRRAWEHELTVDASRKGKRIRAIQAAGMNVLVSRLVDDLTELEALKVEAELICAFGIESQGGMLTNAISPTLTPMPSRSVPLNVPQGCAERAQLGLGMLKDAVTELVRSNSEGATNAEVARSLGLQSDYKGGSKDYLSWSLLGILMREGKLERLVNKKHKALLR